MRPWKCGYMVRSVLGWSYFSLALIFLLGYGCAPNTIQIKMAPYFKPDRIRTVALVPFDVLTIPEGFSSSPRSIASSDVDSFDRSSSFGIASSLSSTRLASGLVIIPLEAAEKITKMVYAKLRTRSGVKTIFLSETSQSLSKVEPISLGAKKKEAAQWLGKSLFVDTALFGLVRVYRERAGSKIAATPAAVGFEMQLVSTVDGSVLWVGNYYEEQRPLTEDFRGFWERKGKFVTAEELAQSGVKKLMQRFPLGLIRVSGSDA